MGNWYVEVRHSSKPKRAAAPKWGSEVTVRIDANVYAQARLRKAVARAVARGVELSEQAKAELVENYIWEAENGIIRR
jgi:hypothetical protein